MTNAFFINKNGLLNLNKKFNTFGSLFFIAMKYLFR
jgi:hypothetical protein